MEEEVCLGFCSIEMEDITKLKNEYLYTNAPPVSDLVVYQFILELRAFEINAEKGINSIKVVRISDNLYIIVINNKIMKIKVKPE